MLDSDFHVHRHAQKHAHKLSALKGIKGEKKSQSGGDVNTWSVDTCEN